MYGPSLLSDNSKAYIEDSFEMEIKVNQTTTRDGSKNTTGFKPLIQQKEIQDNKRKVPIVEAYNRWKLMETIYLSNPKRVERGRISLNHKRDRNL